MEVFYFAKFILFMSLWLLVEGECTNDTNNTLPLECPKSFHFHEHTNYCYKAIFRKYNYEEASLYCATNGSFLANIPNPYVNYFLYEMMYVSYRIKFDRTPLHFWIGLNDRLQEADFEWSRCENGKLGKGKYRNWLREEVDIKSGNYTPHDPEHSKNCVTWVWSRSPGWKTQNCSNEFFFICQTELQLPTTPSQTVQNSSASSDATAALSILHIVLISVGGFLVILLLAMVSSYLFMKTKSAKQRMALLKRTGIYPVIAEVNSTIPRSAWTTKTSFRTF